MLHLHGNGWIWVRRCDANGLAKGPPPACGAGETSADELVTIRQNRITLGGNSLETLAAVARQQT